MQAIGACGKPLVVHNGMYDLMFLMNAFHGPLPERLDEFKAQLKVCLPNSIYDTKFCESSVIGGKHRMNERTHAHHTNAHNTTQPRGNKQPDASALEEVLGQQAALADSTVEGLYTNLVKAEPDGPGPHVHLAPGFEVLCRLCV